MPDLVPTIDLDRYEPATMHELWAVQEAFAREVAHLPLDDALAHLARLDAQAAHDAGWTDTAEMAIDGRAVPVARRPADAPPPRDEARALLPDFDAPIDLDQYESQTLRDVRAIKEQLWAEVAHLPLDEAIAERFRRADEAAREAGFTEREQIRVGDKMVTVLKRPKVTSATNGSEGSHD